MAIIEDVTDKEAPTPNIRSRKAASKRKSTKSTSTPTTPADIPLAHPDDLLAHPDSPLLTPSRIPSPTPSEIDEALRNGYLPNPTVGEGERERDIWDEIFDTAIYVIPFTSLYLMLDILVYLQYSFRPKLPDLISHLVRAIPTISAIVWYTNKYPNHWATNPALMSASILAGSRMIWLFNKASWGVVTSQAPAMGTLWILTIVQLPLPQAVACLAIVGGWSWKTGMKMQP